MMASITSGEERSRSVSSMRRMKVPPCLRANSQLKSAVLAPPTWRKPVGLGAKRTRTWERDPSFGVMGAENRIAGVWDRQREGAAKPSKSLPARGLDERGTTVEMTVDTAPGAGYLPGRGGADGRISLVPRGNDRRFADVLVAGGWTRLGLSDRGVRRPDRRSR